MRGRWSWKVGFGRMAGVRAPSRLSRRWRAHRRRRRSIRARWPRARSFNGRTGSIPGSASSPSTPELTQASWGPHCDFSDGSIDLYTTKPPSAELERVLGLTNAIKQRTPVSGLGKRAFFTVIYPDDQYRRRGLLAIDTGSHLVSISMDARQGEPVETTRPKLEGLAKLVLPRIK